MATTVGVLALQGGYAAHVSSLQACGLSTIEVRTENDLASIDGLVLPGGESTTQIKLLNRFALWQPLDRCVRSGMPVLATCAGMILAARNVLDREQASFGWLDVDVERNGYGRQVHSGESMADPESTRAFFGEHAISMLFIRAPRIRRMGSDVSVMATLKSEPVMVRQGNVFAASFHPELTDDTRIHEHVFLRS